MANVLKLELINYPYGWEHMCISRGLTIGTKIIEEFNSHTDLDKFIDMYGDETFLPCNNKYGINFKRENFKIVQTLTGSLRRSEPMIAIDPWHKSDYGGIRPQGSSDRHKHHPVSPIDYMAMMDDSIKLSKNEVDLKITIQKEIKVSL